MTCLQRLEKSYDLQKRIKIAEKNYFQPRRAKQIDTSSIKVTVQSKRVRNRPENVSKTFDCLICDKKFIWKQSLSKHLSKCHVEISSIMEVEKSVMNMVMKEVAGNKATKAYKCPTCQKFLSNKSTLRTHIRRMHVSSNILYQKRLANAHRRLLAN